jgi:hypothetical protein
MITMADQDDLDMAIETARSLARRENSDMPKLEVSCCCIYLSNEQTYTNIWHRFGLEKYRLEIPQHLICATTNISSREDYRSLPVLQLCPFYF